MNLLYLLKVFKSRIWLLLGISLFAMILTFVLTLGYNRTYKSSAQLSTGFTVSNPLDDQQYNVYEEAVKFNNLIATLKSPVVVSMLSYNLILNDLGGEEAPFKVITDDEDLQFIQQLDLKKTRQTFKEKLENFEVLNTFQEEDRLLLQLLEIYDYDQKTINDDLVIYRDGKTDYINVIYSSENPLLSAFAVNTICQEFIRYYNSIQSARTDESVVTYKKLLDQKQQILEVKSNSLEQYKSSQGVLNFNVESESKIGQIAQAEATLVEERKRVNALRLSLEGINRQVQDLERQVNRGRYSTDPTQAGPNAEVLELGEQIRELNQRYVVSGMSNQTLLDSLNLLRDRRTRLLSVTSSNLAPEELQTRLYDLKDKRSQIEVELATALENIDYIQSTLGMMRNNVSTYASKEARIAALEREVQLATQEYQDAQEKYNTALDFSLSSVSQVRQILYGQPAIEPEPSQRLILTGLAGISTFVLGALIIGLLSYVDVSIKDANSFAQRINAPLIGVVNFINLKNTNLPRIFSTSVSPKDRGSDDSSVFKERLRKIRYEMENTGKKTFLFTSTKAQEGKSILTIALAHTFSLSKKRVLIIDTNFPHNTLTKYFKATPALEEFVMNQSFSSEESKGIITRTGIPLVDIIGCAGGNYSPLEIFSRENVDALITYLSQYYDYILLEGPSLNRFSDTKELALFADKVIAIFSAKSVLKQTDDDSIAFLRSLDDKFMGAILNQVEKEDADA